MWEKTTTKCESWVLVTSNLNKITTSSLWPFLCSLLSVYPHLCPDYSESSWLLCNKNIYKNRKTRRVKIIYITFILSPWQFVVLGGKKAVNLSNVMSFLELLTWFTTRCFLHLSLQVFLSLFFFFLRELC